MDHIVSIIKIIRQSNGPMQWCNKIIAANLSSSHNGNLGKMCLLR